MPQRKGNAIIYQCGKRLRQYGRLLYALALILTVLAGNTTAEVYGQELKETVLSVTRSAGINDAATTANRRQSVPQASKSSDQPPPLPVVPDYQLQVDTTAEIPVLNRIPTRQPVVFLTIDDGQAQTSDATRLLRQHHIRAPMFLNDVYARDSPVYFESLIAAGMTIGAHTVDHTDLTTLDRQSQQTEICDNADNLEGWLGVRPVLFRPPYGAYDSGTIQAAAACGMRAVVMWSAKANGGSMQYQDGRNGLMAGDIVLMHFRPEFAEDFEAFLQAASQAGLQPASLQDWLLP